MNMRLLTLPVIFLLIGAVCLAGELKTEIRDNEIIALFLQSYYKAAADHGKYTIVSPETSFHYITNTAEHIKNKIKIEGYDIGPLINNLVEKNRIKVRLSLKSDPKNGYVVDYDGTFLKSFEKYGWDEFFEENPKVFSRTWVSLPGWNQEHNMFLIYKHSESALGGSGDVIAYKYEKGNLSKIGMANLLISE